MRYETIEKNGKPFVMMPLEEFEKLQSKHEMLSDIEAYDKAKLDKGEHFPAEVVHAIIDGENPIKTYRKYRGLTQTQLAEKAGIARAYLTQIENNSKSGSVSSLKAICKALTVDLDDVV